MKNAINTIKLLALLAMMTLVGCLGQDGDVFSGEGEYVGTEFETATLALEGMDETRGPRLSSTLCECGRIWHPGGWTINCDYWCDQIGDTTQASCGGAVEREATLNEREGVRALKLKKKKARHTSSLKRDALQADLRMSAEADDDGLIRGADGCFSICGDMADGNICGPHACTPEAAGKCCPQKVPDERNSNAESTDDEDESRQRQEQRTTRNASLQ